MKKYKGGFISLLPKKERYAIESSARCGEFSCFCCGKKVFGLTASEGVVMQTRVFNGCGFVTGEIISICLCEKHFSGVYKESQKLFNIRKRNGLEKQVS